MEWVDLLVFLISWLIFFFIRINCFKTEGNKDLADFWTGTFAASFLIALGWAIIIYILEKCGIWGADKIYTFLIGLVLISLVIKGVKKVNKYLLRDEY